MKKPGSMLAAVALLVAVLGAGGIWRGWAGGGPLTHDTAFVVPDGANLNAISVKLQQAGAIWSARAFRFHARLFAHTGKSVKAGEFLLPAGASESQILKILEGNMALRRFVTIPEGMPSVEVGARIDAAPFLTGHIGDPAEGSVMPETYDYRPGESRGAVLARMQAAMSRTLDEAWDGRAAGLPVKTKAQALVLASIVEKETGKPSELPMVAGLYENRLRQGIMLQADPTIIYPITKGRPLGRRILQSEIHARNDWNTYAMTGLPKSPITNPGKASILAVLHPAPTDALYMVADGTGGHAFAATLEAHNRNVAKWFAIRRARGDL